MSLFFESVFTYLVYFVNYIFFFCLVFPFVMVLLSFLSPKRNAERKEIQPSVSQIQTDFGCIITAYQNFTMTLPAVEALLKQNYPHYTIYLVADDCNLNEISNHKLENEKLKVLIPEKSLHSKVMSIRYAILQFIRPHTFTVIFDADNLAAENFLSVLNSKLQEGYKAVQGRRVAKNLDTIYACADALGEIYKNYIERYVPYLLGSSSTIAGSGMAIDTNILSEFLNSPAINRLLQSQSVIVAEDKMLQYHLLSNNFKIAFARNALVYDEKITTATQVKRQRTRWLYAYFENIPKSISLIFSGIINLNPNRLIFGLFSFLPPIFIILLGAIILALFDLLFTWPFMSLFQTAAISIFTGNIFWVLYLSKAPSRVWQAIWILPYFVFNQLLALLQVKRAKKNFMVTQHSKKVSLEEVEQDSR